MKSFVKLRRILLVLFICLNYSCAPTYAPVYPEPVNIKTIIKTGDTVKVTTKDNKEYEFIVVEITEDAIVGETEKLLFKDINKLQKMVATSGESTGQVVGDVVINVPLWILEAAGSASW